ncbi:hypothetical protein [Brevundimonas sp.]
MTTRSPLILAAAVAGLLAACGPAASNDAPATPAPVAPASDAASVASEIIPAPVQAAPAPSPQEGMDWYTRASMDDGQSKMRLAYEMPDSDDQPMGINCLRGSGILSIDHQSHQTGNETLTLSSQGGTRTYPAKTTFYEEMNGDYLTADIPGTDPILAAFRQTGWLRLTIGERTYDLAAHPDSGALQRIDDFFSFCMTRE